MMQRKTVLFIADSLDNAHKFQSVLSGLDVDVVAGSSAQFKKLLAQHPSHDLVIYEARGDALDTVAQAESLLVEDGSTSMLVIVNEAQLSEFRLPVQIKADFVVHGASAEECAARIRQLAQEKRTMVIVTHEMSFARDVADRAIFMDQGRIVEQGAAKALFADPQQPRTRQFLEKFLLQ
mgnify:CR=1 FL=1